MSIYDSRKIFLRVYIIRAKYIAKFPTDKYIAKFPRVSRDIPVASQYYEKSGRVIAARNLHPSHKTNFVKVEEHKITRDVKAKRILSPLGFYSFHRGLNGG